MTGLLQVYHFPDLIPAVCLDTKDSGNQTTDYMTVYIIKREYAICVWPVFDAVSCSSCDDA